MIPPGSTIGILGGGQLGRMLAMAAAQLGYRCHIYAPEGDSVAAEVAAEFTCAGWDDAVALARFAASCAVITYEFENVPAAPLAALGDVPVLPHPRALEVAQDRLTEKRFVVGLGGRTAPFAAVETRADLAGAVAAHLLGPDAVVGELALGRPRRPAGDDAHEVPRPADGSTEGWLCGGHREGDPSSA